jgi:hypothetical protein
VYRDLNGVSATSHSAAMRSFWDTRSSLYTSERPLAKQLATVLITLSRRSLVRNLQTCCFIC